MRSTSSIVHRAPVISMVPEIVHEVDQCRSLHKEAGAAEPLDRTRRVEGLKDVNPWHSGPFAYQICDMCDCGLGISLGRRAQTAVLKEAGTHPDNLAPVFAVPIDGCLDILVV